MTAIEHQLIEAETAFPIGKKVRYFPVKGESAFIETTVRSRPWVLGHGDIVVKLIGRTGGYSIHHLEAME